MERRHQSLRLEHEAFAGGGKRPAAFPAEIGFRGVVKLTSGTLHVFGGLAVFGKRISGLDSSVKPGVSRGVVLKTQDDQKRRASQKNPVANRGIFVYIQGSC